MKITDALLWKEECLRLRELVKELKEEKEHLQAKYDELIEKLVAKS